MRGNTVLASKTSHSVLIVDDDPKNRRIIQLYLERDGFLVMTAKNAKEAFDILNLVTPDVILMDYQMPNLNGIDALKFIRTTNKRSVAIIMTAYSSTEVAVEAIRGEADDFLSKPLSFSGLGGLIKNHIKRRQELFPPIDLKTKPIKENVFSHFLLLHDTLPIFSIGHWTKDHSQPIDEYDDNVTHTSLISGFISAIQGFSNVVFGENLAEISMGNYQLMIRNKENLMACLTISTDTYHWLLQNGLLSIVDELLLRILTKISYHIGTETRPSELHPFHKEFIEQLLKETALKITNMG